MRMPTLGGFFRLKPVSEVSQPAGQPACPPAGGPSSPQPTQHPGGAGRGEKALGEKALGEKALGRRGWSGRLSPDQTSSTCLCVGGLLGWVGGTTLLSLT
jgi:hypothetical protein